MKKLLKVVMILGLAVGLAYASSVIFDDVFTDTTGIVSDATITQNLKSSGNIDYLSFQAIYSTGAYTSISVSTLTVSAITNRIATSQVYATGYSVLYSSTAFGWGGLANNTTYFAIPIATGYIKLASTKLNAIGGTAVDITSSTIALNRGTFTLAPVGIKTSSPYSFRWQVSNDKVNWYNLSATSITITGSTAATNYFWDLGFTTYKFIRLKIVSGVFGAINLKIIGYGKRL